MLTRRTNVRAELERADGGGGTTAGARDSGDDAPSETRIELWRKPVKTGGLNEFARVEERLRTLAECEHIDAVAVKTWDRYVDTAEGSRDDEGPRATLERLRRYTGRDAKLESEGSPAYHPRIAGRGRLGPRTDAARIPRAALVEFEDGSITNVTLADERTGCLTERLKQIAERGGSQADSDLTPE
ncbi:HTH domain-containing protein [Halobellus litoreus]|uniref:HTH domain-containing protein n=1 Tax=Halobellus litoreus TaxID=755310 RepID=A0ABD6DVP1_9EURY|nr:HTH domain-containing protein [Halobellus litoreus]